MNKKGNVFDTIDMVQTLFYLSFTIIIVGALLFFMAQGMSSIAIFQSGAGATGLNFVESFPSYMDWLPLAIYLVMLIVGVYAARRATESGLSLVISYFFIFIISVVIVVFGFILDAVFSSSALSAVVGSYPIMSFYAEYAIIFGVLYGLILVVALHGGSDE